MKQPVVPLIDLSGTRGTEARREEQRAAAALIGQVCQSSGFFAVTGHGVPAATIQAMCDATRALFALPDDAKDRLSTPADDPLRRGFSRKAAVARSNDPTSRLGLVADAGAEDLCETFSVCAASERTPRADNPVVGRANLWPEPPEIRAAWLAYARELSALATQIMTLFALALGLRETWFTDKIDDDISSLTANHYPAQDVAPLPGQIRKGEHTDWGSLTLLYQDGAPGGLQVLGLDGQWHDVPAIEGSFVVNIGDLMSVWTNDLWLSTAHRVVNPPPEHAGSERYSIAYFHQPNFDASISCIPTCLQDGATPRYETVTSGQYLLGKVARMHESASA